MASIDILKPFHRTYSGPLDTTSVFDINKPIIWSDGTVEEFSDPQTFADAYAKKSISSGGQIFSVLFNSECYIYKITIDSDGIKNAKRTDETTLDNQYNSNSNGVLPNELVTKGIDDKVIYKNDEDDDLVLNVSWNKVSQTSEVIRCKGGFCVNMDRFFPIYGSNIKLEKMEIATIKDLDTRDPNGYELYCHVYRLENGILSQLGTSINSVAFENNIIMTYEFDKILIDSDDILVFLLKEENKQKPAWFHVLCSQNDNKYDGYLSQEISGNKATINTAYIPLINIQITVNQEKIKILNTIDGYPNKNKIYQELVTNTKDFKNIINFLINRINYLESKLSETDTKIEHLKEYTQAIFVTTDDVNSSNDFVFLPSFDEISNINYIYDKDKSSDDEEE